MALCVNVIQHLVKIKLWMATMFVRSNKNGSVKLIHFINETKNNTIIILQAFSWFLYIFLPVSCKHRYPLSNFQD